VLRSVLRIVLAVGMVGVGILHFVSPEGFVAIVPRYLPSPYALVLVSGFFEILGGVGLLRARTRRAASLGLIALYIAVFPANVNMAVHHLPLGRTELSDLVLWLRLPFQLVLIGLAWWVGRPVQVARPGG
jgi:uncharacterized membrane protein